MSKRLLAHLRHNIVGYVALFTVLGGVAYAANDVNSTDVVNGSLKSVDLANDAGVRGVDVAANSIVGSDVNEASLAGVVKGSGNLVVFEQEIASICPTNEPGRDAVVLSHPAINGNPGAQIFVSAVDQTAGGFGPVGPYSPIFDAAGVCSANAWLVHGPEGAFFPQQTFQVLVFTP